MRIREARETECEALSALCVRSKAHWGYDAAFMERSRPALQLTRAQLGRWQVHVAEDEAGRRVGVVAVDPDAEGVDAELERLFVEPDCMGRGVGRALLGWAVERLRAEGVRALFILSDPGAEPFYRSQGAVRVGRRPSDAVPGRTLPRLRLQVSGTLPSLRTPRLELRPFRNADLAPFAALNVDPRVGRFLGGTLNRAQSDRLAERIRADWLAHGFGPWALCRLDVEGAPFVGCAGLSVPRFEAPFTPCVEVAWRLSPGHWGQGLATEAARAAIEQGFGTLQLDEVVSFTARTNRASRRVMEKLGMQRDHAQDFDHPALPEGHALRRHVLYRLRAS